MADNYLEKRMEDFRAGKFSPRPTTAQSVRQGSSVVTSGARILVASGSEGFAEGALEALSPSGCKLALAIAPGAGPTALTQRLGVRYYPTKGDITAERLGEVLADMRRNWHTTDLMVLTDLPGLEVDGVTEVTAYFLGEESAGFRTAVNAVIGLAQAGAGAISVEVSGYRFELKKTQL